MQASYVLLMQFYKLHAAHAQPILLGDLSQDAERTVDELRHGLEDIISSMNNFATAFEAIAGMRGWSNYFPRAIYSYYNIEFCTCY